MGCFSSSDLEENTRRAQRVPTQPRGPRTIAFLHNPEVESLIDKEFDGEGIKKTPAYDSKISSESLKKWRKDFWDTRTQGERQIWLVIRRACEASAEDALALLESNNITPSGGSLTLCYDERRYPYRVPITCINEPRSYLKSDLEVRKEKEKPEEREISEIQIRVPGKGDEPFESISNYTTIAQLKAMMDKRNGGGNSIRMFFSGRELHGELALFNYDISNDVTITAMLKQ